MMSFMNTSILIKTVTKKASSKKATEKKRNKEKIKAKSRTNCVEKR